MSLPTPSIPSLPERPRILVVSPQRIGDVLLATPIAHTLRAQWPESSVDFLVLPGTQGALEGNPDIRQVHVFAQRVGLAQKWQQLRSIWNQYDLSIATIASDRARLFAWAAAPLRCGFVHHEESHIGLKRRMLSHCVDFDDLNTHTVTMNLALTRALGLNHAPRVVAPRPTRPLSDALTNLLSDNTAFAVMHPSPKFPYKMWTQQGWLELGRWLAQQGLRVVLTGSPDPTEMKYVESIAHDLGDQCLNAAGMLSLGQTTALLDKASAYIGPDTAMTHIAAATGTPTIALFGPSNPVKWAPWPHRQGWCVSPWVSRGDQNAGNVWLIQGPGECVPCLKEGCDRHEQSTSQCLIELSADRVIRAAREALNSRSPQGLRG